MMQISEFTVLNRAQTIIEEKIKTLIEDKIQTEYSQSIDFQSINFFYLFLARTYVLLNSNDSAFLDEFEFLWDETFP